ncbi:Calcineurin-like phosphoesterase superfamily domain protein [Caballeronia temeraria]|uniref:Calcineurin-like phosphoesterase superfamily domain protein n=2 Tax=Caballeronia temeraria TaxID=1777137 RepID=A0A158AEA9_9BURK|nr:Calcineurin-like phosphoesterase superfamily domain protein [Caballeronia temeraria]
MNGLYADQRVVLDALFADLRDLKTASGPIDLIFFTGDLVGKGAFPMETLESLEERFFTPLLASAGTDASAVFIVPGNHDVEQSKRSAIAKLAIDGLKTVDDVNRTLDDPFSVLALSAPFEGFRGIRDKFVKASRAVSNGLFESYELDVRGKKMGIAALNSAWCATGRSENADYGKLLVGGRQVEQLARSLSHCDMKFALLHHPFPWLAEFDQSAVQRKVYDEFDAVFFGHNHHGDVLQLARPSGKIFVSNAGCLYQGRGYFNSYSIIEVSADISEWTVSVREYFDERAKFGSSDRFAAGGRQTFNMAGSQAPDQLNALPSEEYLTAVSEAANSHLLSSTISEVAPKNLAQLFVVPPLHSVSERQLGANGSDTPKSEPLQLSQLLSGDSNVIFVGAKESGKTTLLTYICTQENGLAANNPTTISAYVNLHALTKQTKAAILQAIVGFSNGSYPRSHFVRLLELGRMTLCLDNLDLSDSKLVGLVEDFFKQYPNNKYYITILETVQTSLAGASIPALIDKQLVAYVHSFGRKQARELMHRWFQGSDAKSTDEIDNILASLKRLNIPRTPFLISIFLWVHERNIAFDPVNHAEVLDTLIDGMLDKFHESKSRSRLDSTAKRHFLSDLAFYMYQLERDYVTSNELEMFTASYFKNKLLTAAGAPFIEELVRKGVLHDIEDAVYFKFDCLRAFFLSTRLQESQAFFRDAFTAERLLTLGQEIDYFTGKQRGRDDALRAALVILDEYYKPIRLDLDLSVFEKIDAKELPITVQQRDDLKGELFPPRLSDEHREEMLDEADAQTVLVPERRPTLTVRKAPGTVPDFISALQITSAILRNSELIDDGDLKRSAYRRIAHYWCEILLMAIFSVELRHDNEAFVEIKKIMPMFDEQTFDYLLKLVVPNVIGSIMFEYLGTNQLEVVLKEHAEGSQYAIERLVSTMLQIDLSVPGYLDAVEKLSKDEKTNKFTKSILFMKLLEKYMFKSMPSAEAERLRKLVGNIFVSQRAGGGNRLNLAHRDQLISAMDQNRRTNLKAVEQ